MLLEEEEEKRRVWEAKWVGLYEDESGRFGETKVLEDKSKAESEVESELFEILAEEIRNECAGCVCEYDDEDC